MEFIRFWVGCVWEGWHVGEGVFGAIEGICFLVGAGLQWLKKSHRLHGIWERLEPKIMKWAFAIFAISFLVSTVFVAPFIKFRESEKERSVATNEVASYRGAREAAKQTEEAEAKERQRKRDDALEAANRKRDRTIMEMVTNSNPARAAIVVIADTSPQVPAIISGKPFDLVAAENTLKDKEMQMAARKKVVSIDNEEKDARDRMDLAQASSIEFTNCAPVFDYVITNLFGILSGPAFTNGELLSWNYTGLPVVTSSDRVLNLSIAPAAEKSNSWKIEITISRLNKNSFEMGITYSVTRLNRYRPMHQSKWTATMGYGDKSFRSVFHFLNTEGVSTETITTDFKSTEWKMGADEFINYMIAAKNRNPPHGDAK